VLILYIPNKTTYASNLDLNTGLLYDNGFLWVKSFLYIKFYSDYCVLQSKLNFNYIIKWSKFARLKVIKTGRVLNIFAADILYL
jgi:hypothetical protein